MIAWDRIIAAPFVLLGLIKLVELFNIYVHIGGCQ